jgi:hypothetical protein
MNQATVSVGPALAVVLAVLVVIAVAASLIGLQAGATQLLVLVALLAAEAIAAAVTLELVARGLIRKPALMV